MMGLLVPDCVRRATDDLFEAQDLVAQFLAERVEKVPGGKIRAAELFRQWTRWREAQGEHSMLNNATVFGKEMIMRGLQRSEDRISKFYVGVQIIDEIFDDEEKRK